MKEREIKDEKGKQQPESAPAAKTNNKRAAVLDASVSEPARLLPHLFSAGGSKQTKSDG